MFNHLINSLMRNIKTFLLAFVALWVVQGAAAQSRERTVVKTDSTTVITIVKTHTNFTPKHDIRAGVGTVSLPALLALDEGHNDYYPDFRRDMANADTYLTPRMFVGNYSLTYTYQDRRWLQYGGQVVFGSSTRSRKNSFTHETVANLNYYVLSVMPPVRFSWF